MPGYLSKSACNGQRPSHLAARRHYPRPDIIAKLLRERHVARFLVAPEGFGKTGLVLEYCDVVFSFEHVFWLNGRSPCFLRDLDRDIIVSGLSALDDQPFLVVVEDAPQLDATRAAMLSASFDELLDRGCEVLVTCTPSGDSLASLQHDRVKLTAHDLLLSDTEVDAVRPVDEREKCPASVVVASERIPGLRWARSSDETTFLEGIVREELPVDMLLAVATMLVLQKGAVSDVSTFGPCSADLVSLLAANYPYLGIDGRCERFRTAVFSAAMVAKALSGKLDTLAQRSCCANRDTLAIRWADALITESACSRACELVGVLCSREARVAWLTARSLILLKKGCVLPAHDLYCSLAPSRSALDSRLELGEVMRLIALGDEVGVLSRVRRIAFDSAVSDSIRALALLVLARRVNGKTRNRAHAELARIAGVQLGETQAYLEAVGRGFSSDEAFWKPLAIAQLALVSHPLCLIGQWEAWRSSGADDDALALVSGWALAAAAQDNGDQISACDAKGCACSVDQVATYVCQRLECSETPRDLLVLAAGLRLEQAREQGIAALIPPLASAVSLALHHTEMELLSQRRAFERAQRDGEERRVEYASTHPDAFLDGRLMPERTTPAATMVPLLTVNLFGGLDVRIGGEHVEARCFRRQKVKTLLALLVLNRGREFPRDRLVQVLWPDSELETARKNFYSIWSELRRALSSPSGACPYLVRHQNGCRLDDRLLVTDIARFDAVCRMLLFGQPGSDGWARLYAEIDDAFADDLMPSENENPLVMQARGDCRMQLVDALVAAANRLVAADDAQEGLWFARAALRRDRTREDAYVALMEAQIAAGQRTAAMETYFSCRRFLTEELGIDPSLRIMALYRSIIETEEPLD